MGSKRNVKNRTSPKKGLGTRIKEMHHTAEAENKNQLKTERKVHCADHEERIRRGIHAPDRKLTVARLLLDIGLVARFAQATASLKVPIKGGRGGGGTNIRDYCFHFLSTCSRLLSRASEKR